MRTCGFNTNSVRFPVILDIRSISAVRTYSSLLFFADHEEFRLLSAPTIFSHHLVDKKSRLMSVTVKAWCTSKAEDQERSHILLELDRAQSSSGGRLATGNAKVRAWCEGQRYFTHLCSLCCMSLLLRRYQ